MSRLLFITLICSFSFRGMLHAQSTNISGTINVYASVTGIDTSNCPAKITVSSSTGFTVGDSVLIIQMKGADFDSSNTISFGALNALGGAGNFEIAKITAINSNTFSLNGKLVNTYKLSGFVQVIRIPQYTNAIVTGSLSCPPWNGSTGGVLVLTVQNMLQLNAAIDVSGKGFRGGTISNNPDGGCGGGSPLYFYPLVQAGPSWSSGGAQKGEGIGTISGPKGAGRGPVVSGGGGGNKHNTGGGGGSNFTAGGKGGDGLSGCNHTTGGLGGNALSPYYISNKLFLGGGGGCGDFNNAVGTTGESGGGIVIVTAGSLVPNGNPIRANGNSVLGIGGAAADGAGGGGAGGVIFLNTGVILGTATLQANGGNGGNQAPSGYCVGPGGGGGSGTILTSLVSLFGMSIGLQPGSAGIHVSGTCLGSAYGAVNGFSNAVGPLPGKHLNYTLSSDPNLSLTISSSQPSICAGASVNLSAGGASSYTWQPGSFTGSFITVSPSLSTQYTLSGANPSGCANTSTFMQTVNPNPVLSAALNPTLICSGNSSTLSVSGASSYTWLPLGSNASLVVVSPSVNTNYTVIGLNSFSCSSQTALNLSVNPTPSLNALISPTSVCPGQSVQLSVSGAGTYTWSTGFIGNSFSLIPNAPASYSVTGSTLGCTASANVFVAARPITNLSFNTFSITCGSLGSATANVSGGIGPFSFTWNPTNQNSAAVSGLFPGTYTLTVFDQGTGCTFTPSTTFLPLVPLTGTVISSPSLACFGIPSGTASITLAGGSGNQSYNWQSTLGSQSTPTANSLPAGIASVTVIDALTFCSVTHTFLITQPPAITLNIAASNVSVCLGGALQYTASASGGGPPFTYTWLPSAFSPTFTAQSLLAGNYMYTVVSKDSRACLSTASVSAMFVPLPTVSVAGVSVCPMVTATLSANGASTYTWNSSFAGNPYTVIPSGSTVYPVIGSLNSCTASSNASVTMLPAPSASASNSGPVCSGQSLQLNGSGGVPLWSGPLSFSSALLNPVINSAYALQSGPYYLKVSAANGCTNLAMTQVSIHPVPIAAVLCSMVCEGQTATLSAYFPGGNQYIWQGPNAFTSTLQTELFSNASTSLSGLYSLTVTTAFGCTNSASGQMSVVAHPQLTVSGDSIVCFGETLWLSASSSAANYLWSVPNGFQYSTAVYSVVTAGFLQSGIYTVSTVYGPCSTSTLYPVQVYAVPGLSVSNNSPVCENNVLMLQANGPYTYNWNGPQGLNGSAQIFSLSASQFSNAGQYTLNVMDVHGCQNFTTCVVQILANPVPTVTGATVCIGNSATLSASGGTAYSWTGPSGFSASGGTISLFAGSTSVTGVYSVVTSGANSCTLMSTASLVANPFPLPQIGISGSTLVCLHSGLSLTASGGNIYLWQGPQQFTASGSMLSIPSLNYQNSGTYTLTVSNASHCVSGQTLNVLVAALPEAVFSSSLQKACAPLCTDLQLVAGGSTSSLFNSEFLTEGQSLAGPENSYCFRSPGVFSISASFADTNSCYNTTQLSFTVYPKPNAQFRFSPEAPLAGQGEVLFTNASLGEEQIKWTWFFMGDHTDTVETFSCTHLYEFAGNYPLALVVENAWHCMDTVIEVVRVEDDFALYVPNAFSPNHDGLNDQFQAKGTGFSGFSMDIFDRWGALLFHSSDLSQGWDGYYRGDLCKSDAYTWIIQFYKPGNKLESRSGELLLIR
ncbi:MAG TPA: gliding motility-associated C-terminal domain-containing protein [Bacteroidia bacterium]|nr:gliding motility-associated C-terminal domain-containing protein [Bacteroidia bacterium]